MPAGLTLIRVRPALSALYAIFEKKEAQPTSCTAFESIPPARPLTFNCSMTRIPKSRINLKDCMCWNSFRKRQIRACTFFEQRDGLRLRCEPFLRRATLRCARRSLASAALYQRGLGMYLPLDRAANDSSPTSIPISFSRAGSGLGWHSTEKHAYH